MKLRKLERAAALALTLAAGMSGAAMAQTYEMKLAHSNPEIQHSHLHSPLVLFKKEVERRTGGDVAVTIFPNGTLGKQPALLQQLKQGVIQAVSMSEGGIAPFYPNIAAFSIPYLFSEVDIAYEVLDGEMGDFIKQDMVATAGVRPLAWGEDAGFRNFTSNSQMIKAPSDLEGMKVRTMTVPAHMAMVEAMGGSPTAISWPELYTALQTGVAEAQENPVTNIRKARLYEVQENLTLDGHVYSFVAIFVNEEWFQTLPESYQRDILLAGQLAADATRSLSRVNENIDLEYLKEQGMEIYAPTFEEKQAFKDASQAAVIDSLKETLGEELIDRVLQATANAEVKLGYR